MHTIPLTETSSYNAQLPSGASIEKNAKILQAFDILIAFTDTYKLDILAVNVSSSLDSNGTGLISNERNFKLLKHCCLYQPGSKKFTASGGCNKVGHIIERGSLVTLKLYCRSVTSGMTDICKYHVLTVHK